MTERLHEEIRNLLDRYEQAPNSRLFAPLADAYRKDGQVDKAIELCETGLERYPEYASAHVILGKCFYDKGATERARAEFQRVLQLDRENMVALKFMGDISLAEGQREEAADYYKQFLVLDPTNGEVSAVLKEMEEEFQVREIDLENERTVKRVEHPRELATMTLAGIYAAQGYYNKALKIYQDVLHREPNNSQAQEMIEKLQGILNASESDRSDAFKDEVLTISLDDVSGEVVDSTAGSGGVDRWEPGGGEGEPSDESTDREAARRQEDDWIERETGAEDIERAVEEIERVDREDASGDRGGAGATEGSAGEGEAPQQSSPGTKRGDGEDSAKNIDYFQEWLRRMKGGKE